MSKLDLSTIVIVALCVFALGFLIWKTVGLNNEKNVTSENNTQVITPRDNGAEDYEFDDEGEIVTDDAPEQPSAGNYQEAVNQGDELEDGTSIGQRGTNAVNQPDYNDKNSNTTSSANNGSASSTASRPAPTFYDDDSRGQYLVLAGAFRVRDNGVNEARRIRRMGFPDAEMTLMDRGTYATVLVDRFQSVNDAKELVQDLQAKGVESYVHQKR